MWGLSCKGCVVKKPVDNLTLSAEDGEALIARVHRSNLPRADAERVEWVIRMYFYATVRQKAKHPQSTYVRVRRVREDVFSWSAPGASLRGDAWPASDRQAQSSGDRAITPRR